MIRDIIYGILILCLFAIIAAAPTRAAEPRVTLHTATEHSGSTTRYNETNPGIGVAMSPGPCDSIDADNAVLGVVRNSYDDNSAYAGCMYGLAAAGRLRATGVVGGITGYEEAPVMPLLGVQLRLVTAAVDPTLTLLPYEKGVVVLFSISKEW